MGLTGSKLSVEDVVLSPHGVPDDVVELIHVVRVIAAEVSTAIPGQSGSVGAIAERTGLSVDRVRTVLAHPDYRAMLCQSLKDQCVAVLNGAMDEMRTLIHESDKPMVKINATRAVIAAYSAINGAEKPHQKDLGQLAFEEMMAEVVSMKKAEVELKQSILRVTVDPTCEQPQQK